MKKHKLSLVLGLLLLGNLVFAQSSQTVKDYIATYREAAIQEMKRSGVPAAITLAQGIHESMAGQSDLVVASNNHFGIKCKSDWTGPYVLHDDDARGEKFRKYDSPFDSYKDHSDFCATVPDMPFYSNWTLPIMKAGPGD